MRSKKIILRLKQYGRLEGKKSHMVKSVFKQLELKRLIPNADILKKKKKKKKKKKQGMGNMDQKKNIFYI